MGRRPRRIHQAVLDPQLTDAQRLALAEQMRLALENRRGDLKVLDDSRAILNSIEQLDVEGLTERGPTDGRFVGPAELQVSSSECSTSSADA